MLKRTTVASLKDPTKAGWLMKQGHFFKNWKKRWFVLKDKKLFYFGTPTANSPKGVVLLDGYYIDIVDDPVLMKKAKRDKDEGIVMFSLIHTLKPIYTIVALDEEEMKDWIQHILLEMYRENTVQVVLPDLPPEGIESPSRAGSRIGVTFHEARRSEQYQISDLPPEIFIPEESAPEPPPRGVDRRSTLKPLPGLPPTKSSAATASEASVPSTPSSSLSTTPSTTPSSSPLTTPFSTPISTPSSTPSTTPSSTPSTPSSISESSTRRPSLSVSPATGGVGDKICPRCKNKVGVAAKYCGKCGEKQTITEGSPSPASSRASALPYKASPTTAPSAPRTKTMSSEELALKRAEERRLKDEEEKKKKEEEKIRRETQFRAEKEEEQRRRKEELEKMKDSDKKSAVDEKKRKEEEERKKREADEKKRKEDDEKKRKDEEERKKREVEEKKKREDEEKRRKEEEDRRKREAEEKKKKDEEEKKRKETEEKKKREEEEKREQVRRQTIAAEDEKKRKEEEKRKEDERKRSEEDKRKKEEEERKKKLAEDEKRKKEEEERKRREEDERKKKLAEDEKKKKEEEERKRREEDERKKKLAEEERRKKDEEERKRKALEDEKKRKEEEERKKKQEDEEKRKKEEEKRKRDAEAEAAINRVAGAQAATPQVKINPPCAKCGKPLAGATMQALGKEYHTSCFDCGNCNKVISGRFAVIGNKTLCEPCALESVKNKKAGGGGSAIGGSQPKGAAPGTGSMSKKCFKCQQPLSGAVIQAIGQEFHERCFGCFDCGKKLTASCLNVGGKALCDQCGKKNFITAQKQTREQQQQESKSGMTGLLQWCKNRTAGYAGVEVTNFIKSWQDGLAYCALLHSYRPDLIDFKSLKKENKEYNINLAFDVARKLNIEQLLDPEDFALEKLSMMTYLSQAYLTLKKLE